MTRTSCLCADRREARYSQRSPILALVPVLLVLFAVSACVHEPGVEASRSTEPVALEPGTGAIHVIVDSNGDIRIDGQVVDAQATRARIERMHAVNPDWPLIISADASSSTSVVVAVLDAAHISGVGSISIVAAE